MIRVMAMEMARYNVTVNALAPGPIEIARQKSGHSGQRRLAWSKAIRKNFLFVGSNRGGRAAAVAYSLIQTCKLHHIEPFAYLADVPRRLWGVLSLIQTTALRTTMRLLLSISTQSWPFETTLAVARMIFMGMLERYRGLRFTVKSRLVRIGSVLLPAEA